MRTILPFLICIAIPTAEANAQYLTPRPDPNAELARQYDQRMAQRDREQEAERTTLSQQAAETQNECNRLRNERNNIQRQAIPIQQTEYWRNEMNRIRVRMSQLHC
ncbi:hypothetical protein [Ralstonia pseudosolanacearum]|uniref:hypothetical protein n=1 Tax=Ralstonia pseudosolanacearum TaxID=1310165 RepID=UPI001FF77CFC|nr:hypothetical protein [Ralstonia pseudosolanacearum]